jgi:hypothetical protein
MVPVDLAQWRKKKEERDEAPTAARFRRQALWIPTAPWAQVAKHHSAHLRRKLCLQLSEFWKLPSPTAMLSQRFVQIYAPSFRARPLLPRIELPPEIQALVGVLEAYESGDESAFWNFVNEWFIRRVTGRRADFHQRKELKRGLPNLRHTPIHGLRRKLRGLWGSPPMRSGCGYLGEHLAQRSTRGVSTSCSTTRARSRHNPSTDEHDATAQHLSHILHFG